jgi:peptidyl-prolyl cis-trans isomerase-like 1
MSNKALKAFFLVCMIALSSCSVVEDLRNEQVSTSPKIVFNTTEGSFTVQLYTRNAPKTCDKFIEWCKGVEQNDKSIRPVYQGLNFYSIEPGGFIQTGDPFNSGMGEQRYTVPFERTYKYSKRGCVFLPNLGAPVNSSIFCVLLVDKPKIGDRQTVFGEVTQGLEICDMISNAPYEQNSKLGIKTPKMPIKVISVDIIE